MTTVNQQKAMFYNAGLMSNITMLAERVKRTLDFKYLQTCDETELRQLQDNLIEQYNNLLAKEKLAIKKSDEAYFKDAQKKYAWPDDVEDDCYHMEEVH